MPKRRSSSSSSRALPLLVATSGPFKCESGCARWKVLALRFTVGAEVGSGREYIVETAKVPLFPSRLTTGGRGVVPRACECEGYRRMSFDSVAF